jgi:hypothetical protein
VRAAKQYSGEATAQRGLRWQALCAPGIGWPGIGWPGIGWPGIGLPGDVALFFDGLVGRAGWSRGLGGLSEVGLVEGVGWRLAVGKGGVVRLGEAWSVRLELF